MKKRKCKLSKSNVCEETEELCVGDETMAEFCDDYEEEEELKTTTPNPYNA